MVRRKGFYEIVNDNQANKVYQMIKARMEILTTEVLNKCKDNDIEVYALKRGKANCIAFTSNNRRRREFEITFLKDSKYRISTRFLGYRKVMADSNVNVIVDNDPDGRRIRYSVYLCDEDAVNRMLLNMLAYGFSQDPVIERC